MPQRHHKKRSGKLGLAPGTPVYIGDTKTHTTHTVRIQYNEASVATQTVKHFEELKDNITDKTVTWINVDGVHEVDLIEHIGKMFNLHGLSVEDIVNTDQRPKIEDHDNYLYIVLKMLTLNETTFEVKPEQISLILGHGFVISFQEDEGDVFDAVRDRIMTGKGRVRKSGCDYLVYALLDAIVDHYFVVLEKLSEKIEQLEDQVLADNKPSPIRIKQIHTLKKEVIYLHRTIWPLREVFSDFAKAESPLLKDTTRVFIRDVLDHTIQIIESIQTFRDMLTVQMDMYLSYTSHSTNEVMRVLTIIATIFIPITFVVGIYGMNFRFMPELEWEWGYPMVWIVIIFAVAAMLVYFKRNKWL